MPLGQPGLLYSRPAAGAAGPSGLYVARRDGPEDFLPTSGAPINLTGGAASMVFGAWTAVGTHASDFFLSTIHAVATGLWGNLEIPVLELAYGDAKTPIDVTRSVNSVINPGPGTLFIIPFSIVSRAVRVPANETIYARLASSGGGNKTAEMFINGWSSSLPTWQELDQNTVPGPGRFYPSNTAITGVGVMTGASWAYGSSFTVVDPAPNDMLITQLASTGDVTHFLANAGAVQIGYGPNGDETWCATALHGRCSFPPWVYPPVLIKAGERLALRGAAVGAVALTPFVKVYDL